MEKYYCIKCDRYHRRGKIYKNHLVYRKGTQKSESVPSDEIIKVNYKKLRPIAKNQLLILFKKLRRSNRKSVYREQINKLIRYERNR